MILRKTKTAVSGLTKWKTLQSVRRIIQGCSLILFLYLLTYSPLKELFFRLNPFAGLNASIASRSFLYYFWPGLLIIIMTILFGRAWCGWICPLGTILDIAGFKKKKKKGKFKTHITWPVNGSVKKHDKILRKIKYIILVITLVSALFGSLSLLVLDPITLTTRTFTTGIIPALNHIITEIELFLYKFDFLSDIIDAVDSLIRGTLIPFNRIYFNQSLIIMAIFTGILLLNFLAHRFWCRYLCPFGALLAFISRFSLFKRQVTTECTNCSLCNNTCYMDAIHPEKDNKSDQSECTLCLDCFTQCSKNGTRFSFRKEKNPVQGTRISRREFLVSAGVTALGIGFLKGDVNAVYPDTYLIRPPGVTKEADFLSKCIRCGQCIRVCPTSGLQLSSFQSGIHSLWSPQLVPRFGACDFTCNLCGQICPSGAIPNLPLSDKQQFALGKAAINPGRCLEWAEGGDCLVCREFCPLPVKAIERRTIIETDDQLQTGNRHGPVVNVNRCIGCGICENLCPVEGTSAIRVTRKKI